ncbi:MAG TPA: hypothetical protein ENG33_05625 [Chloroflexi bacterium]|nr:hypothetical protein [Chloroflexota bacterium]
MERRFSGFEREIIDAHSYVVSMWPNLIRKDASEEGNRIVLPYPYVFPNEEFFPYLFYWDSYFTIEGLSVDGCENAVRDTVENFLWEMENYGHVLNYSHARSLTRSQPPYLDRMVAEVMKWGAERDWVLKAYELLRREYEEVWLGRHSTPTGLARYCDWGHPDDETRAQFESGWDFSTRWAERCRFLNALDLNCNLYSYEKHLASLSRFLSREDEAAKWEDRARHRKMLINRHLYDSRSGLFFDYDYKAGRLLTDRPSLALFHPLFVGVADEGQAHKAVAALPAFEQPWGLACTKGSYPVLEGEARKAYQWDYPNGWAPLHWIAVKGLKKYGFHEDAARIALKWLSLCASEYQETGFMWEKYNVVEGNHNAVSSPHYPTQRGFGWTNGVFSALLGKVLIGLDKNPFDGHFVLEPMLASPLAGKELGAVFPNYYGHRVEVRFCLAPSLRRAELRFSADRPVRLRLLIKDLHPDEELRFTPSIHPSTLREIEHPYPHLVVEWDGLEEMEGEICWCD